MIDLQEYGYTPDIANVLTGPGEPARVMAVMRERYELITADGCAFARLKASVYYDSEPEIYPTVGDFVALQERDRAVEGDRVIVSTLPRMSQFLRRSSSTQRGAYQNTIHEQAIAANFDICLVVTSMNRDLNIARLERYLSQAWNSGATPVIVLTKSDLAADTESIIDSVRDIAFGTDVIAVSSVTGTGLDALREALRPCKTAVLLGSSGVGKSSLVNALSDEAIMRVNAIREDDSRGRHTTTHRQMIRLPWGALIIDTPGMRELGMWDAQDGLTVAVPDVDAIVSRGCKFSDCRHEQEPGCVIRAAIDSGELSLERWHSYVNLQKESRYTQDKLAYLRDKSRRNKEIAKYSRSRRQSSTD